MLYHPIVEAKSKIKSDVLNEEIYNLLDKTFQIPDSFAYQVVEVTDDYIARMDAISMLYYNTTDFTDILCKLNGISNPFELNTGDLLIIPEQYDLSSFFFNEPNDEKDSNIISANNPIPKTKKEKRKPNEAVVGDKRYKIDSANKVIIY